MTISFEPLGIYFIIGKNFPQTLSIFAKRPQFFQHNLPQALDPRGQVRIAAEIAALLTITVQIVKFQAAVGPLDQFKEVPVYNATAGLHERLGLVVRDLLFNGPEADILVMLGEGMLPGG